MLSFSIQRGVSHKAVAPSVGSFRHGRSRCRLPVEDASSDIKLKHQCFNSPLYHLNDALLRFNLGQLSYQRSAMSLAHR